MIIYNFTFTVYKKCVRKISIVGSVNGAETTRKHLQLLVLCCSTVCNKFTVKWSIKYVSSSRRRIIPVSIGSPVVVCGTKHRSIHRVVVTAGARLKYKCG